MSFPHSSGFVIRFTAAASPCQPDESSPHDSAAQCRPPARDGAGYYAQTPSMAAERPAHRDFPVACSRCPDRRIPSLSGTSAGFHFYLLDFIFI